MIVTPIKTDPIIPHDGQTLTHFLDVHVPRLHENTVLAIASKVVAILEGRVVKNDGTRTKESYVPDYAQWYIPSSENAYGFSITITDGMLVASAGIDESNGAGHYILWPEDAYASARTIWQHLRTRDNIKNLGIIITDGRTTPLRWGVTAQTIGWCGLEALRDYRGTPDIFGHHLRVTRMSVVDNLACAAAMCMGEGSECRPLATITDIPGAVFFDSPPTAEEITAQRIRIDEDIYGVFLKNVPWKKGKATKLSKK